MSPHQENDFHLVLETTALAGYFLIPRMKSDCWQVYGNRHHIFKLFLLPSANQDPRIVIDKLKFA